MPTTYAIPGQTSGESREHGIPGAENSSQINSLNGRALTAVTPYQAELVATIVAIHRVTKCWPSCLGVARAIGRNVTAMRRRLLKLERLGVVMWAGGDVRVVLQPDGVFLTLAEVRA